MSDLLSLDGLSIKYGNSVAVSDLNLRVAEGELVGLIGHNGAGKSSTLKAITGVLRASTGTVIFDGTDITRARSHRILESGLALVPEGRQIFTKLSVEENLLVGATVCKDQRSISAHLDTVFDRFPQLVPLAQRSAGLLSGGEQQMLAIGRALMARPRMLLLDEPSLGLAPLIVDTIFELLTELKAEGLTVLLVEQNAARTIAIADRFYLMRTGGIITAEAAGGPDAVTDEFEQKYLGFSEHEVGA